VLDVKGFGFVKGQRVWVDERWFGDENNIGRGRRRGGISHCEKLRALMYVEGRNAKLK